MTSIEAALLGPAACAEADRLADEAPLLTAEQRAALAVLLRRPSAADDGR